MHICYLESAHLLSQIYTGFVVRVLESFGNSNCHFCEKFWKKEFFLKMAMEKFLVLVWERSTIP